MYIFLRWLISALSLLVVAQVVPGVHVNSFLAALVAAIILGLANAFVRPLLLIVTLPITILTLGIFTLVINGLMLLLTAGIVKGFSVDSLHAAVLASLVLWLIGWFANWIAPRKS